MSEIKDVLEQLAAGGTLAPGAETAVSGTAVLVLAANAARKRAYVQNTGTANVRVGAAAVTATTGLRLTPGTIFAYEGPGLPLGALYAIREGSSDSVVFAQEVS